MQVGVGFWLDFLVEEGIALSSLDVLLLSGVILPYFVKLLLTLISLLDQTLALFDLAFSIYLKP